MNISDIEIENVAGSLVAELSMFDKNLTFVTLNSTG